MELQLFSKRHLHPALFVISLDESPEKFLSSCYLNILANEKCRTIYYTETSLRALRFFLMRFLLLIFHFYQYSTNLRSDVTRRKIIMKLFIINFMDYITQNKTT